MKTKKPIVIFAAVFAIFCIAAFSSCDPGTSGGDPDVITIAVIPGVTAPVAGANPVTEITATDQYTGTVAWKNASDEPHTGPFAVSTVYTATITLTPKAGYTLDGVTANFFTVAGTTPPVTNAANSGVITATFPVTDAFIPTVITIAAIPGVTVPVTGATPVSAITETDQYTGTVEWNNGNPVFFAPEIVYTVTITLTPKAGYILDGVTANFFTVEGTSTPATNSANSGIITAVFPAGAPALIINSVEELTTHLAGLSTNTASTPYLVALNVSSLTNIASTITASGKYVSLDLSDSTITSIGYMAFHMCSSLTSVTIPNNVTSIGYGAFSLCCSLASIVVASDNTAYSSEAGVLFNKTKTVLIQYPVGKTDTSVTIPGSVTSIEDRAFYGCSSLASVTIPASVTSIGISFGECTSLTSVSFESNIIEANFNLEAFYQIGDLRTKYLAGGPGTYIRPESGTEWTKQP